MRIDFFKNLSEKNRLQKTLTYKKTVTGNLKNKTSVINPVITIANKQGFNIFDYNYIYIYDLNRYYFIDNIIIDTANTFTIELSEDVLMSYKNDILNLNCQIKEYSGDNQNNTLQTSEDFTTRKINYNNPFKNIENSNMILVALNGGEAI